MSETHRIENLFTPAARAAMRAEIEAVRGAEVFFVGRLDASSGGTRILKSESGDRMIHA